MREAIEKARIDADIDVVQDGHAATWYLDAADANENASCPDLILLDLNLPKKSGDEALKHLQGKAKCKYFKVLIVSSSDAPRERAAVETSAIAGYFKKPSSHAEFMTLGPLVRGLLLRTSPGMTGAADAVVNPAITPPESV
jgi:DNA-binding response OmpR family regulator